MIIIIVIIAASEARSDDLFDASASRRDESCAGRYYWKPNETQSINQSKTLFNFEFVIDSNIANISEERNCFGLASDGGFTHRPFKMAVVVCSTVASFVLYLLGQTFSFHGRRETTLIFIVSRIFQNHSNNSA